MRFWHSQNIRSMLVIAYVSFSQRRRIQTSDFFRLTYEAFRSNVFVYAWRPSPAHRRRTGNSHRAVESRTQHGAGSSRSGRATQAHSIHNGTEAPADHG